MFKTEPGYADRLDSGLDSASTFLLFLSAGIKGLYNHIQHDSAFFFFFFLEAFSNVFDFSSLVACDRDILPPDMLVGKVIEAVLC